MYGSVIDVCKHHEAQNPELVSFTEDDTTDSSGSRRKHKSMVLSVVLSGITFLALVISIRSRLASIILLENEQQQVIPRLGSSRGEGTLSLLLLRHAKAEHNDHKQDSDRELTTEGQFQAKWIGRKLHKHHIEPPDLILVSSSERTIDTLNYVLEAHGWANHAPIVHSNQLYDLAMHKHGGYLRYLVDTADTMRSFRRILIVGHNPALQDLYQELRDTTRHNKKYPDEISTGSFFELRLPDLNSWSNLASQRGKATVAAYLRPKTKYFHIHSDHH